MNSLKMIIYLYAVEKKFEMAIDCFISIKCMLNSGRKYNIVFLDYDFNDVCELENVMLIRREYHYCSIILLSNGSDFKGEMFKLLPNSYLTYPIKKECVYNVLNEFLKNKGYKYPLIIKSIDDYVCINTSEIMYIEANNKYCIIHLENKIVICHKTMASVYNQLPKLVFLKINRAFVVNSCFISKFNNNEVVLKNNEKLYISRNWSKNFKESYISYIKILQP